MAELKTKPTGASVKAFIDGIPDETKRADCRTLPKMMQEIAGTKPRMWGPSIVGFGSYHYKYASGREGDWFLIGFAPRKQDLTLYIMGGIGNYPDLMKQLGKHKASKACLYVKRLSDIDPKVLRKLAATSIKDLKRRTS